MVQPPNFQLEKMRARGYTNLDRHEALLGLARPFNG